MFNQCTFIGNMGADPESRSMGNGETVTNFRIACTEKWKDKQTGENKEKTEWISCTAYRGLGEIVGQYGHKGMKCFVQGRMQTRKWQDKTGADRYTTEIIVDTFKMLGSKSDRPAEDSGGRAGNQDSGRNTGGNQGGGSGSDKGGGFDDDIPF
jgi:single-strand DNA-binding protein